MERNRNSFRRDDQQKRDNLEKTPAEDKLQKHCVKFTEDKQRLKDDVRMTETKET